MKRQPPVLGCWWYSDGFLDTKSLKEYFWVVDVYLIVSLSKIMIVDSIRFTIPWFVEGVDLSVHILSIICYKTWYFWLVAAFVLAHGWIIHHTVHIVLGKMTGYLFSRDLHFLKCFYSASHQIESWFHFLYLTHTNEARMAHISPLGQDSTFYM
jgi:hypothetical protein